MRVVSFLSKHGRFVAPVSLLAGILATWLAAGCGSSYGASICDATCECMGCSTVARDTCVKDVDDSVKVANDVGCGEPVDVFLACVADRSQCIGGEFKFGGCDIEAKKAGNCLASAKCFLIGRQVHCGGVGQ